MQPALYADALTKQFGSRTAVDNLSFEIRKGEIFALLGPNGAGKTTTVRMLMNIIQPDSGTIRFNLAGGNGNSFPAASELGYLPEERGLYQEVPIWKTLDFMGAIRGMTRTNARSAADQWLEKLGLSDRRNEKLNALSKGNQQKIQFISAVLHNPGFLILDEPFSGFDPLNQETFLSIIRDLSRQGTTILLSAHQMHLVERIADRVLLINSGKEVASGTVHNIKASFASSGRLFVTLADGTSPDTFSGLAGIDKYEPVQGSEFMLTLKNDAVLNEVVKAVTESAPITAIRTEHYSLHDIFIELIGGGKGAEYEQE